jgi:glycosyltransferase involved in cell wall biosynthesis
VRERIARHGLTDRVAVAGPVPYRDALAAMRDADALVQTSMGFETQGLTPFEAAALGTPTVFCDHDIADDVAASVEWRVADESVAALARTLRVAAEQLAAGLVESGERDEGQRVPEPEGRRFLQSAQTARMIDVYERALRGVPRR